MLPNLLDQIPSDQEIGSVTGDGAYDTRKCHDPIAARNAYAVMPHARMPRYGNLTRPEPGLEMKRFDPQNTSGVHWSGKSPISSSKPRRKLDALCETAGSKSHGEGLRRTSRGNPNPRRDPQWLRNGWHPRDSGRRQLNPSGVRGSPTST